jgi:ubiquinone/menaquinone biosynthesis C-methylase UbiE
MVENLTIPGSAIELPGVHPSPNIQKTPEIYEIENHAVDPEQKIEACMSRIAPWDNKVVLDLGAGDGFHVPRLRETASWVIAVEPHGPSVERIRKRVASLDRVDVYQGSAEHIPLPDHSVDVVHCRFAYFWGPGCEPGLAELERVIRPGGTAFIVDNDYTGGTFAHWVLRTPNWTLHNPAAVEAFFLTKGFTFERIVSEWNFARREDFESVIRIEFPAEDAEQIIREHKGTRVDYHFLLMHRQY